jgi:hypothetical protein
MNREGANACHLQHPPIHAYATPSGDRDGKAGHLLATLIPKG